MEEYRIPDEIKKDWRIRFYTVLGAGLGLAALLLGFLPSFRITDADGTVTDRIGGFVSAFGGPTRISFYYPQLFGIVSYISMFLASVCALAFYFLLVNRKKEGKRRFRLLNIGFSLNVIAFVFLFLSIRTFRSANVIGDAFTIGYAYGLILQAMLVLSAVFFGWFFLINVKNYIKE